MPVTLDVSLSLNLGERGPVANIRMLVEVVPDYEHHDDIHEKAKRVAMDHLRPFLNNSAYFGGWEPMIVEVNRG